MFIGEKEAFFLLEWNEQVSDNDREVCAAANKNLIKRSEELY